MTTKSTWDPGKEIPERGSKQKGRGNLEMEKIRNCLKR